MFKPRSFDLHSGCRVVCAVVSTVNRLLLFPYSCSLVSSSASILFLPPCSKHWAV